MLCAIVLWYTDDPVFDTVLVIALLLVPMTAVSMRFMKTPYGRFADRRWPSVNARVGWLLMELPATLVFWPFFLAGPNAGQTVPMVLATLWGIHYLNRGFVFPLLIRVPKQGGASFGLPVLLVGVFVTSAHGYLNGTFFSRLGQHFTPEWLTDPRFLLGVAIYASGLALNVHSDAVIRNLRSKAEVERGDKIYRIPRGGGFRFVSNPHYLGELIMWSGFTLFTWSLPGVFILLLSAANLVLRATETHRWYRERFPDYPRGRRALVPFLH
jgi:3-oxo-5-alpha-steroid 4-dehydrogenase 1